MKGFAWPLFFVGVFLIALVLSFFWRDCNFCGEGRHSASGIDLFTGNYATVCIDD